ncbi:MAG: hypothetical protein Alpg2KO_11680 [Alphaproteobacteria bacterium]
MGDQPRLIILDARYNTRPFALAGRRMADLLRAPKPPLFVMPGRGIADRPDMVQDNGRLQEKPENANDLDFDALARKLKSTLQAGRDVVLMGPQRQTGQGVAKPPVNWAEDLAKAAGARLLGYRVDVNNNAKPEDPDPASDWPYAAWKTTDDATSFSIQVANDINRKAPRGGAKDIKGRLVTVVMDDKDARRDALRDALHSKQPVHLSDLDVLYRQLKREEENDPVGSGMVNDVRLGNNMFPMMEKELLNGLRSGRDQVVLVSSALMLRYPNLKPMLDAIGTVMETAPRHVAIRHGDQVEAPSQELLSWPDGMEQRDAAAALAHEICEHAEEEPSLEDLLNAPRADRRQVVMTKPTI